MSEWITDRKPTEQDGDEFGHVYNADLERVMYYESSVRNGKPWCKVKWVRELPEPYQPPDPETSLSASIERMTEFEEGESGYPQRLDGMSLWQDDLSTILEAARKWDEHECGMESLTVPRSRKSIDSGDKPEAPVVSSGDKRIRCVARVVAFDVDGRLLDLQILKVKGERQEINKVVDLVQVLPDDPDPEWTDELVRLCDKLIGKYDPFRVVDMLSKHLANRGEK